MTDTAPIQFRRNTSPIHRRYISDTFVLGAAAAKKPPSTGKRAVNKVPKGTEPPAEPKGKDAEEEEAGSSQGRPKRARAASK